MVAMMTVRTIQRKSTRTMTNSVVVTSMRRNSGSVSSARFWLVRRSVRRRSPRLGLANSVIRYSAQRLLDIGDEVYGRLDTDAQTEKTVRDAGARALFRVHVLV